MCSSIRIELLLFRMEYSDPRIIVTYLIIFFYIRGEIKCVADSDAQIFVFFYPS